MDSLNVTLREYISKVISTEGISALLGNLASICFFLVYIPQFILNFKRKSVEGFSLSSVVLKLIGSAFLCVNSIFNGSRFPLFLYGFLNTVEHSLFLFQFSMYGGRHKALIFLLSPIIPYLVCKLAPNLIKYTDLIKPISQVVGHVPQLISCIRMRSTKSVSIIGEHLHFIGSVLGFLMLIVQGNYQWRPWFLYSNTLLQALSTYATASFFGDLRLTDEAERQEIDEDQKALISDSAVKL